MPPERAAAIDAPLRPAAFLDRDGVINVDHGYTYRVEDLQFTPTAVDAICLLNRRGYHVIVATNQSGVARGLYRTEDVEAFHAAMQSALAAQGARIDAFYYCAFHPDGTVADYAREHDDRKPGAGMLLRAMRDLPIDRSRSFMIGDKPSDAAAAEAAGLPSRLIPANVGDLAAAVREMIA
jgi:D-glycero-D-manno-heptose 1,7-bisphosphate phosphatase